MSKYRIGQPDQNGLVWIEDTENRKVFNGYDFMGGVNWEDYGEDATWLEPEEAEQIVKDLESADEPTEPAKIVINTDDLMKSLKTFLENIGCTNVQITALTDEQIASMKAEATEI